MKLKNDLILKAAKGENISRTPVWLMRQAGRILPEYRKIRNSLSGFKELVKTPKLAAEVTIQPVDILDVDAAIIFSDILVVPEAMGLEYQMVEKRGPYFPKTISNLKDINILNTSNIDDHLSYVFDAIRITKKELNGRVPLIGFAGAPWTILAYMIEGQGSKTFSKAKSFLYREPKLAHLLLNKITDTTIKYLKFQILAGADLIQIFDSWAGILSPDFYNEFGLKYIKIICNAIDEVPTTNFSKGAYFALEQMKDLNCNTIGLDWTMNIDNALVEKKTKEMLGKFENNRHIANLGHGVYPDTDPEKVKCFIETVKSYN